jgi:hypothetical protein
MVDRRVFVERFEPVVQPHEYIQTFPKRHYYEVLAIYGLPELPVNICDANLGHLNAPLAFNVQSLQFELPDIYLDNLELGQYRWIPREDFAITWMAKPLARPYYTTRNQTWQVPTYYLDPRTNVANEYLHLSEIFQFEDTRMFARATAYNPLGIAAAHLDFFGFRFILAEVAKSVIPQGLKPTVVVTEGYPGTVEETKEEPSTITQRRVQ